MIGFVRSRSVFAVAVLLGLLAIPSAPTNAQLALPDLQSKIAGTWLVTVEGESRTRTMVIDTIAQKADGAYVVVGTFNFSDGKTSPFKDGHLLQSSGELKLALTTIAGSLYVVTAQSDGTFAGTTKYANGQVKPTTFSKGAVAPAAASPAAMTEFDGKWGGSANPEVSGCVEGKYDLVVKDGAISGIVTFFTQSGPKVSDVTGRIGRDKSANLALKSRVFDGRSSRVKGAFDRDEFKGEDAAPAGGRCAYAVKLKKEG